MHPVDCITITLIAPEGISGDLRMPFPIPGSFGSRHGTGASPRSALLTRMGFSHDPFSQSVAEIEITGLSGFANFFSYFTSPHLTPAPENSTLPQSLRESNHVLIFGRPGSGKTTLRFLLEADCRTVLDDTLVVTLYFGDDIPHHWTAQQYWQALAKNLATDLFLQVVEQFNPLSHTTTAKQVDALHQQFLVGGRPLRRLAERILADPSPNDARGIASYFPAIGKFPIRYIAPARELLDLIDSCRSTQSISSSVPDGWEAVQEGLDAAHQWGYERILVLVDGVDNRFRASKEMKGLIQPLLDKLPFWSAENVFFKYFLPVELERPLATLGKDLLSGGFSATIEWSDDSLRELMVQRFRAAGSRYVSFDQVVDATLPYPLDDQIIRLAHGSPRELLRFASEFVNYLATNTLRIPEPVPQRPIINEASWNRVYYLHTLTQTHQLAA